MNVTYIHLHHLHRGQINKLIIKKQSNLSLKTMAEIHRQMLKHAEPSILLLNTMYCLAYSEKTLVLFGL